MGRNDGVSISVIKRLPRYYRFLGELKSKGIVRISSKDLSEKMGFTGRGEGIAAISSSLIIKDDK